MKISKKDYEEFKKQYAWMLLKAPDYRLGQAFLNYFPDLSKAMIRDGATGTMEEFKLFNEKDPKVAQKTINKLISKK